MRQERLKREQEKPLPQQNKWEPRPLVEQPLKWVAPFSLALFSSTQLHWSDPAQEIIRVLKTVLQHNLIGSKYLSFAPSLRTEEKQRSIWTTSQYSLHLTQWSLLLLLRSPWARLRWTEAKTGILMIDWLVLSPIHINPKKDCSEVRVRKGIPIRPPKRRRDHEARSDLEGVQVKRDPLTWVLQMVVFCLSDPCF